MNALEPRQSHPLFWVLTEVLGVAQPAIAQRAGISRTTLKRLADGQYVKVELIHKVAALVADVVTEIAEDGIAAARYERPDGSWAIRDTPELFAEHRRHCMWLATRVVALYARPQAGKRPFGQPRSHRARKCYDRLTALLGRAEVSSARVIVDQLVLEGFSRSLVFQAAAALKVVRETHGFGKDKYTVWALPKQPTAVISIVRDS